MLFNSYISMIKETGRKYTYMLNFSAASTSESLSLNMLFCLSYSRFFKALLNRAEDGGWMAWKVGLVNVGL